jgi:hypothetical protein
MTADRMPATVFGIFGVQDVKFPSFHPGPGGVIIVARCSLLISPFQLISSSFSSSKLVSSLLRQF